MFDMEYFIDKNNFHINAYSTLLNAAYEDESENLTLKPKFLETRTIFVHINITSEVKTGQDITISKIFIKSIKLVVVNSKNIESEFVLANVKPGEGRLHGVLSKNDVSFQYFLEKGRTDILENFCNMDLK